MQRPRRAVWSGAGSGVVAVRSGARIDEGSNPAIVPGSGQERSGRHGGIGRLELPVHSSRRKSKMTLILWFLALVALGDVLSYLLGLLVEYEWGLVSDPDCLSLDVCGHDLGGVASGRKTVQAGQHGLCRLTAPRPLTAWLSLWNSCGMAATASEANAGWRSLGWRSFSR